MSKSPEMSLGRPDDSLRGEVLQGLFYAADRPDQNSKWKQFGASDADLARAILLKAHEIRLQNGHDAATAYIEGATDVHALLSIQMAAKLALDSFNPSAELAAMNSEE